MVLPPEYEGNPQAYIKHELLRQYLERLAYHVLSPKSGRSEFVYVDGFSGPWNSARENFADTSFMIALETLRRVRNQLSQQQRKVVIKCLFIEAHKSTYDKLVTALEGYRGVDNVLTLNDKFEAVVPEILSYIGDAYSLVFADPKGWTNTPYSKIKDLLQHEPGEIVINFMYEFANRALGQEQHDKHFNQWFGGDGWRKRYNDMIEAGTGREDAVCELLKAGLKDTGAFNYVVTTPIARPNPTGLFIICAMGQGTSEA